MVISQPWQRENSLAIYFGSGPGLSNRGIIPGIHADTDAEPTTQGLDAAAAAGARFSKWRAPNLCNSLSLPAQADLEVQAEAFLATSRRTLVHVRIINMFYARCAAYGVLLDAFLSATWLKHSSHSTTSAEEIGLATATTLTRSVPIAVTGDVYLSGGLSGPDAVKFLNAVDVVANKIPANSPLSRLPHLAFSSGRGLQGVAVQE
ncbi:aldolase [Suillus placidus]|uniref:fructose-bisphosphate aldolase n=1 Tax=Suillus placidus TaxID=48579 RepID=A0A9P6ZM20_9AGAM|nr:aldolase [Suillus placidus]